MTKGEEEVLSYLRQKAKEADDEADRLSRKYGDPKFGYECLMTESVEKLIHKLYYDARVIESLIRFYPFTTEPSGEPNAGLETND
jgi:hypothetical protein